MSMNLIALLYLVASVFFIQALKGLSHPTTSIRGNVFGMTGMTIAVLTTIGLIHGQAQALQLTSAKASPTCWAAWCWAAAQAQSWPSASR